MLNKLIHTNFIHMKKQLLLGLAITFLSSFYTKAQVLLRECNDGASIIKLLPEKALTNKATKTFKVLADLTKEKAVIDTAKTPYKFGKPIQTKYP